MADTGKYIEELWIGIKADYASLQTGLKMAQNEIKAFSQHVGSSSDQLRKFGTTTTLISTAMAGFGLVINNVFAQFEQSMANTFSVLSVTKKEMQEMSEYARLMGQTTVFSASQAADAMYYLASAGYSAQESIAALKGVLNLASATQYDLAQTTEIVVGALNSYGFSADQATRVANVFAASIGASQATMEKLGYSFAYVAPIAAGLGIRFEELTAALGVLYDAGIQASTAGTSLRQILARLQAPTPGAIKALEKLGLTVEDVNPQFHSLTEIIRAFEVAGAGAIDKGDELAEIFDIRSVAPFQVLLKETSDSLEVMETKITGTDKASEMAKIQINTFSGAMKLLKAALQEAAIQIGESLQPILRTLLDVLTTLSKVFNALPSPVKTTASAILAVAVGLGLMIGPLSIIIAKMPTLIAQVTALGTSMSISLGIVGLVATALSTLIFLIGTSVARQDEQNRSLSEGITKLKDYNISQIAQKEKMRDVIRAYVDLADKQNKTTKDVEAQKSAFNRIKELYPSLITSTDDYTTAVNKMKTALGETNTEIEDLYKKKVKLRELELRIEKSEAEKSLRELEGKIKDVGTVANDELNSINSIGGVISAKIEDAVDVTKVLNNTWKEVGNTINKQGVFSIENMSDKLETVLTTQDGLNRLTMDSENILENISNLEAERSTLQTEMLEKQNELQGQINEERKVQIEGDKYADENKLYTLNKTIGALLEIQNVYNKTIETGKSQLELQTSIIEKEAELNELKKEGLKTTTTPPTPKGTPTGDLTEEEKKRVQELEREIYALKKRSAEIQLGIYEKNRDDSLEADMKYLDAKHEIEKMDLEFGFKQKEIELVELKASNDDMLNLKKLLIEEQLAIDELYLKDKELLEQKWFNKTALIKENEFKYSLTLNQQDLINWRKTLDDKRIELENNGKKYTAEWADIVDKINATTKMLDTPMLNKMQFEIEMFKSGEEGYEGEALDKYYNYLQQQLELTKEWSDEYLDILLEMENVKDEMIERELEKNRLLFLSIKDIAMVAQAGIASGFDYMWNKYIIGAREAKNEMDAIWLAIKNAVLRAIADIIQAEITKLFLQLLAKIGLSFLPGVGGVAAIASEAIPAGATGAQIMKSGSMVVHKDEMVIPARIVRANDDKYRGVIEKSENRATKKSGGDLNLNLVLNNPSVDDKRYWESVIENHIEPAFVKLKKRYE